MLQNDERVKPTEQSDEVEGADWYPAADVYENDGEYTVAVDLPGIDRAALDISVDDNRLTIRGTRAGQDTTQHRGNAPGAISSGRLVCRLPSIKMILGLTIRTEFFKFIFPSARSEKLSEWR